MSKEDSFLLKQEVVIKDEISEYIPENTSYEPHQFSCSYCIFQTDSKLTIKRHELLNHTNYERVTFFKCYFCTYSTNKLEFISTHLKRHVEINSQFDFFVKEEFQCRECDYGTSSETELEKHESSHHQKPTFQCFHCNSVKDSKRALITHIKQKHKVSELKLISYKCKLCSHTTKHNQNLKRHYNIVHNFNKKLYKCILCTFKTDYKVSLEQPAQVEEAPVQNECDKEEHCDEDGKRGRRIKAPNRYMGALQGKELDKVFKQEGVIDEESLSDGDGGDDEEDGTKKGVVEEIIGRLVDENGDQLGQPVVVNRNFNKPKARNKIGTIQSRKRRKYQCDICGREFLHYGRYVLHRKMHDVEYTCSDKECGFKTDEMLLEQHQQETGHSGRMASEKIDEIGTLQLPEIATTDSPPVIEAETNTKKEQCVKCNKEFTCKQNYQVHCKTVHQGERPFACSHCDKRFSHAKTLRLHLLSHNKKNGENCPMYRCSSCPKTFRHASSLQYHRDSQHTDGRRFVCNKCDKSFKHRQLLQRHQVVHTEERPHRCFQCSSAFKTNANLIFHTRTVHAGQRSHWCGQCDKVFAHKTALKLHHRWHSGVRPFKCDLCSKSFSQKGNLAEHRRIHTGEKPYQCDHCGKAFTTSSQFRLHRKRHLGERPHKCDHCRKSFVNKDSLRIHIKRHFDERPFTCQLCSKSFKLAWALKKHERLHTGEKPHHCDQCPKTFADSSNLAKHKRTHNNVKNSKQVGVKSINLTPLAEKSKSDQLTEAEGKLELKDELLSSNIQFLDENDTKSNIQFIS